MNRIQTIIVLLITTCTINAQNIYFDECTVSPMYPSYEIGPNYHHKDLNEYFKGKFPINHFKGEKSPLSLQILIDKSGKSCLKTVLNVNKIDGSIIKKAVNSMDLWIPAKSGDEEINVSLLAKIYFKKGHFEKIVFLDATNELSTSNEKKNGIVIASDIDVALEHIETLTSFSIYGKGVSKLDPRIVKLKNIKELYLGKNQFEEIPKEIFLLDKLEQLHIYNNRITSIPSDIINLKNLKFLFIHDNNIEEIPDDMERMKNLIFIKIDGNPLKEGQIEKLKKMLPKCQIM